MSKLSKFISQSIIVTLIIAMVFTTWEASVFADDEMPANEVVSEESMSAPAFVYNLKGEKIESENTYTLSEDGTVTDINGVIVDNAINSDGEMIDAYGIVIRAAFDAEGNMLDEEGNTVEFEKTYLGSEDGTVADNRLFVAVDGEIIAAVSGCFVDDNRNVVDETGAVIESAVEAEDVAAEEAVSETVAPEASAQIEAEEEAAPVMEISEPAGEEEEDDIEVSAAPDAEEETVSEQKQEPAEIANTAEEPVIVKAQATSKTGWKTVGGYKYYYYTSTKYYKSAFVEISSKLYAFDEKGHLIVNAMFDDENNLYASDANGVIQKGVFKFGSDYYYASTKTYKIKLSEGFVKYGGNKYYVTKDVKLACNKKFISKGGYAYIANEYAKVQKGVFKWKGKYYLADPETYKLVTAKGWTSVGDKKYYIDGKGNIFRNGFRDIDGHRYYFHENGEVASGVFKAKDGYYYYAIEENNHIKVKKDFVRTGGRLYYVNEGGKLKRKVKFTIGGKTYVALSSCKLAKGKFKWKGNYYYAEPDSVIRTKVGFVKSKTGVKKYYVRLTGMLKADSRLKVAGKKYIVTENGTIGKGFFYWRDELYYANDDCTVIDQAGFYTIGDRKYFIDEDSKVAMNTTFTFNKVTYQADENGTCTTIINKPEAVLNIARKEIGTKSGKKYWDANFAGALSFRNGDATPWCGCFVVWCYRNAGMGNYINSVTNVAYVPSYYSYAKSKKKWYTRSQGAKPGDLILFDYNLNGTPDHVGMVEKVTKSEVTTIEGNVGSTRLGEVKRKTYASNYRCIFGYVRLLPQ